MKNKESVKVKKKLKYIRLCRLMFLFVFSFFVLYVIGFHSSFLIKEALKNIFLVAYFTSIVLFVVFLTEVIHIKAKVSKKIWFLNVFCFIYAVCAITGLVVLYSDSFMDSFITQAMGTKSHQYYCQIFYGEDEINMVLNRNYIEEVKEEVNTELIVENTEPIEEYEYDKTNQFETDIFKGHTKEEIYRMLRFKVNGQDAYLAVIYDAKNLSVASTKALNRYGEYVVGMAKRTNALVATNGGRFIDVNHTSAGGTPAGVAISNGKILTDLEYRSSFGVIGLNNDNVLVLHKNINAKQALEKGIRDCVTSGPFLIVNGKSSFVKGNGGYGYDARTAIGQRPDGIVLLLVVDANDTRTNGASMSDLTKVMNNYGAINAAALDGGTSSVMVEKGVLISDPINSKFQHKTRPVPTAMIVTAPKGLEKR